LVFRPELGDAARWFKLSKLAGGVRLCSGMPFLDTALLYPFSLRDAKPTMPASGRRGRALTGADAPLISEVSCGVVAHASQGMKMGMRMAGARVGQDRYDDLQPDGEEGPRR